ncbi:vWA domain-containing protein [Stenotrophomonas humi]|nr:VWA domain-containing protein [Stenotrophomonas humi]
MAPAPSLNAIVMTGSLAVPGANTEVYERPADNPVKRTTEQPVSTFSVDVDTGSYSNVRRMLESGVRPPADAVRAEEFINYFDYNYAVPADKATPFRVHTELANAPWDKRKQVMMIGIKGYEQAQASLPPMNLVFLIDTSGSMYSDDKLPLLKRAFAQLVPQLRKQDRVAIVAYAGSAGLVLEPTSGDQRGKILAALEQLQAGGSTNGGAGIELAYAMAAQSFIEGGANRVILATDGDFNVGIADRGALETLVGDRRKSGIALTTLGFGTGNYNDAMAERLADVGNGNHAYIDSLSEARRVLVREMGSTLFTIASDVKIQVEFNPARVSEYRLIGYENRVLNNEDFANDKVDAGDIGPGHEVTALYEIVPVGSGAEQLPALRYGDTPAAAKDHGNEVAEVRLRYKLPGQDQSALITRPILASSLQATPSESLRFASAVAGFADALRGGQRMPGWSWEQILATAREARGDDPEGERAQFIQLVSTGQALIEPDATVSGARN